MLEFAARNSHRTISKQPRSCPERSPTRLSRPIGLNPFVRRT
ncbi:hypothetical protein NJ7G_1981 [Natrinema sp. J7-2]|nr:hypothetical protein NJ7G_1981 [Natrinema sp. J7-2]